MIIRSRYRVRLLSVIARYKYLPIKNTEVLLHYYPELGDRKKLLKTLYNFAYEGLIKKVDSGEEGKRNDVVTLTAKGRNLARYNDIPVETELDIKRTEKMIKQQCRVVETELFAIGNSNVKFENRNEYYKELKNDDLSLQYTGSRAHGLIETDEELIPVYNLKKNNMRLSGAENFMLKRLYEIRQKEFPLVRKQILLMDDYKSVKKMLWKDYSRFNTYKQTFVFSSENSKEHKESYVLVNNVKQQKLLEMFNYKRIGSVIKKYISEMNDNVEKIEKKYAFSSFETEELVVVEIISQNLNEMDYICEVLESIKNGESEEERTFAFFTLEGQNEMYDTIFASEYKNIEKYEMKHEEILKALRAGN